ncbi:MAG: D-aminoacylase [Bacteroidetes bacterium]|nr:D-aminoacylase [Bacteroidota bacterium]
MKGAYLLLLAAIAACFSCSQQKEYDVLIRNAMIYDGNGGTPYRGDIGINADTIAAIGNLADAKGKSETDAKGMAVAPGFINMLSWATESLIVDGNSQSDIRQGVTLEVMGEGESMGPWNPAMKKQAQESQSDIKYDIAWNTLGEYLQFLEKKGISCNVASYVGATTIRTYVVGEDNRAPTPVELDSMRALVQQAMKEGAMGVGSSLIYPPAFFAKTDELIALCSEAGKYGGGYISHMRSEGNQLFEAVEEMIRISKEANVHGEIYHLKAGGKDNWPKMDSVLTRVNRARKEGIDIGANIYTYTAGGTGLTASMPPTLQDGGFGKLRERLQNPAIRQQTIKDMKTNASTWENLYYAAGSPDKLIMVQFTKDSLKKYTGKTLAEIAAIRGKSAEETAIDLIVQDSSRVETIYFLMDEENVKKEMKQPWVSFGSDAGSYTPSGVFLKSAVHPRAYGNFARVLGKYVRDEKVITLPDAIRKLSKLSAEKLKLKKRGELAPGYYADIVIFDPQKIEDHATFEKPHQYATGMIDVFVNGVQVLKDGEHTNAKPGRFIKGPGYSGE